MVLSLPNERSSKRMHTGPLRIRNVGAKDLCGIGLDKAFSSALYQLDKFNIFMKMRILRKPSHYFISATAMAATFNSLAIDCVNCGPKNASSSQKNYMAEVTTDKK